MRRLRCLKNVQIPEKLFIELVKFVFFDAARNDELQSFLINELNKKIDKMAAHEAYSTYKNADSKDARESARKKYLELKGISTDFRW